MRPGNWPDTYQRAYEARAILNGEPVDVDEVSLTSEMTADLVSSGSVAVTDGTVGWAQQSTVATTTPQPFVRSDPGWPPPAETPVAVEVGDGTGQWWRQVTGQVESSSGGITSPAVRSRVVDFIDRFSIPVQHIAVVPGMPPEFNGGAFRYVGLTGTYVTDLCARAAGYYATPPARRDTCLSVPCMGSLWPEAGTSVSASRGSVAGTTPFWRRTAWGLAVQDVEAEWRLASFPSAVVATACLTDQPGTNITFAVMDSDANGLCLLHSAADNVAVGVVVQGAVTMLEQIPRQGADRAAVEGYVEDGVMTVNLRLSDGRSVAGTSNAAPFGSWAAFSRATLFGDGAMGGLLVEPRGNYWTSLEYPTTAAMRIGDIQFLEAMPSLRGQTALSLLTEQAAAECASMWLDSTGRLRWVSQGLLEKDAPVAVKTTELAVDDLGWEDNLSQVRGRVIAVHRVPAVSRNSRQTITLWESSAETLDSNQVLETWLTPGSDEDWLFPGLPAVRLTDSSLVTQGSRFGAIIVDETPNSGGPNPPPPPPLATEEQFTATLQTVGDSILLTQTAGSLPAGTVAVTQVPDEMLSQPRFIWGSPLPLLRGRGRVQWAEQRDTFLTGAADTATSYEHQFSWWVQNASTRQRLVDWLVDQLGTPAATVTSVAIDPDPRLELGDKITVSDPARTGLELDLVITRIDQSWNADAPTMTVAGRVTRIERTTSPTDPVDRWAVLVDRWAIGAT